MFLFGSFSEDEASLFQSSSEFSSNQKNPAASKFLSKENGFHFAHPPSQTCNNLGKANSAHSSKSTAQLKDSQTSGKVPTIEPADTKLDWDSKLGKLNESPNNESLAFGNKVNKVPEEGTSVFQSLNELSKHLVMEQQGLQEGASDVEEVLSFMLQDLTSENQTCHETRDAMTNVGVVDFSSKVISESNSSTDGSNATSCKSDSDAASINSDVDGKSRANGAGTPVSVTENSPKTWAARLGVQTVVGHTTASVQKGNIKSSSADVLKASDDNLRHSAQVTELTGESWLRSLNEAEVSGKRLQPRGLINTGNLCFLNATLQALLSCTPFVHLLHTLHAREISQVGYPTLRACVDFLKEFEFQHDGGSVTIHSVDVGKPFIPAMFDNVLQRFNPQQPISGVGRNRQEDAQEFLSFTMDNMHEELLQLEGSNHTRAGESFPPTMVNDEDDWETVGPKNRTAVVRTHTFMGSALSDIFGGKLCSVVKTKGIKASMTVQPFLLLHLDILPEAVHTVEDALKLFAAPESLEGYKTTSGKATAVSASKSVKLQSLPRVLILHLMRFSYGPRGSSKLHKALRFPLHLNVGRDLLANTIGSSSEGRHYELVATVTHHGKDPSRGHYTADSKQSDGQWLRYDDGTVSVVGLNRVLQDQAYLLFYKRHANSH